MVEYRVLSTFVFRRLNTDLKDFTFDLWKKHGTMKTVKICSGNIGLREVNIDLKEVNIGLREVNIDLREVRFIAPRLYIVCVILAQSYTWKTYLQALKLTILQELF